MSRDRGTPHFDLLFVDDQADVARTLRMLLKELPVRVSFASDGVEAYERCLKTHYSLLIIDLQMPPGRWGGLWLIKELRKNGFRTPILVLSGEAGQAETIEALRLKADDFVIKHQAQEELRDHVAQLIASSQSRIRDLAPQLLPTPVAIACSRIEAAQIPAQRLKLTLLALEAAIRMTCLIAIAESRQNPPLADDANLLSGILPKLLNPSMGTWEEIRQQVVKRLSGSIAATWGRRFDSGLDNEAIRIRNELSHVTEPSDSLAEEMLQIANAALDNYLERTVFSPDPKLVIADRLTFSGAKYQIAAYALHGGSTLPRIDLYTEVPVVTGHTYLWVDPPVSLFPLIRTRPGREFGTWDVHVLDGGISSELDKRIPSLKSAGSERLRYIEVREGTREILDDNLTLAQLLGQTSHEH